MKASGRNYRNMTVRMKVGYIQVHMLCMVVHCVGIVLDIGCTDSKLHEIKDWGYTHEGPELLVVAYVTGIKAPRYNMHCTICTNCTCLLFRFRLVVLNLSKSVACQPFNM